jgi:hypothetical protein
MFGRRIPALAEGHTGFSRSELRSRLFSGRKQRNRKATYKLQLEALEKREVMTLLGGVRVGPGTLTGAFLPPPPTTAGLALINSLPDTPVRSTALADYQRDGEITRNDMIDIFFTGTTGYTDLTNSELVSLQTLVKNGPTVAMPDYVQNLASKVLAGVPVGGLSPAQTLKKGVDNFFLGLDHPEVTVGYIQVHLPLWNGAPSPKDVAQHYFTQTNWLLTGLEEVVSRKAADIMSMFIDNGDQTYTVRFYHGKTPDYVTVDSLLPNTSVASVGYADTRVLWVPLVVKAYAQENAAGWLGSFEPGVNSYGALGPGQGGDAGDPGWAFSAITGLPTTHGQINPSAISAAWLQGHYVALHTLTTTAGADPLLFPEASPDSIAEGDVPFARWYALVNYVPDATWGGLFTITEDGKRFLEVGGSVLADNFDRWVGTFGSAAPVPQPHLRTAAPVVDPHAITVVGFVPSAAQPAVVTHNQTQSSLDQNTSKAFTGHSESHAVTTAHRSAHKKQGDPFLVIKLEDTLVTT